MRLLVPGGLDCALGGERAADVLDRDDRRVALRHPLAGLGMERVLVLRPDDAFHRLVDRLALGDLEQHGRDVVVAAPLVRLSDQRARGRVQVVPVAVDDGGDPLDVDHRRQAVRAEQEEIALLRLDGEGVDVDVGVRAERARDH